MKPRLHLSLCLLLIFLFASSAHAQWKKEQFLLKPGWNAIYLHVDPSHATIETLAAPVIDQIWMWKPAMSPDRFLNQPSVPDVDPNIDWAQWKRNPAPSEPGNSLIRLIPNKAYLVHNSSANSTNIWAVIGKPVLPQYDWWSKGENFIGFSVPDVSFEKFGMVSDTRRDFSDFLGPVPSLKLGEFFWYEETHALAPTPLGSLLGTPVTRGQAYWIRWKDNFNRFFGAFEVSLQSSSGLHFSDTLANYSLRIKNNTSTKITVRLELLSSEAPPANQPPITAKPPLLARGQLNTEDLTYDFNNFGTARSYELGPSGSIDAARQIIFGLDRRAMTAQAGSFYAGILRLSDDKGFTQIDLPVSAVVPGTAGLWVGNATVTHVQHYLKAYQRDVAKKEGLAAELRLNENTGTLARDSSPSDPQHDGTLINGPAWQAEGQGPWTGDKRAVLSFDGSAKYVALSDPPALGNQFTLEAWVYPTATGAAARGILGGRVETSGQTLQYAPSLTYQDSQVQLRYTAPGGLKLFPAADSLGQIKDLPALAGKLKQTNPDALWTYLLGLGTPTLASNDIINWPSFITKIKRTDPDPVSVYLLGLGTPLLAIGNISDSNWLLFANKFKSTIPAANHVSLYVRSRLSSSTAAALDARNTTDPVSAALKAALVGELNTIIAGVSIFDAPRFASVTLRPETALLRSQTLTGDALRRLNRLLLEDAYSELTEVTSGYRLRNATLAALRQYTGLAAELTALKTLLVADLNSIIGGPAIFNTQSFSTVILRAETAQLNGQSLRNYALKRRNRMLLEDVYPEWAKSFASYRIRNATLAALKGYADEESNPEPLQTGLVQDLNGIISGGESIYDSNRFASFDLRDETRALADSIPPVGNELKIFNRLLVEDAYPEFWKHPKVEAGQWTHVAVTCDSRVIKILNNGVIVYVSAALSAADQPKNIPLTWIGRSGDEYFQGRLAQIRLWRAARSEAQIAREMNNGTLTQPLDAEGRPPVIEVNNSMGKAARPFPLRLILHHDSQKNTRLLQRVFVGLSRETNAIISIRQNALHSDRLAQARRISAAHLPWSAEQPFWDFDSGGDFAPDQEISVAVTESYQNGASNPFLHSFHPDHDNLDAQFTAEQSRGMESYDVQRRIILTFAEVPADFQSITAAATQLSGDYAEEITFFAEEDEQRVIRTAGKFSLNRISDIPQLTQ